ncbi:hypothetical protein Pisl_1498 [Pyrobaculum islandicum DSM 4184]|uniref:Membrane protein 6-pyruvoyl-tetrahydropterin synthase-related domain-containing protein n=1 Tax=Pyrobaculum islandicum (strain DSM 4184 / JCM 9189 / GEO3) TaxID=384616 RepID=A1RUM2_PYRIL|nr:hypothetical protein Pisl_1498 [Pyrobaculum islandicum DSM 4184]
MSIGRIYNNKILINSKFVLYFIVIIFYFILTLLILAPVLMPQGIPFYGDEVFYPLNNISYFGVYVSKNPVLDFYIWKNSGGPDPPLLYFSHTLPLYILITLFGQELGVKAFQLILASIPGIFSFISLYILLKEFKPLSEKKSIVFSLIGSLIYSYSFYSGDLTGLGTTIGVVYGTFPLMSALSIRFLKRGNISDLFFLSLLSMIASAQPFWIYLLGISLVLSFLLLGLNRSVIKRLFILGGTLILANSFWIWSTLMGYLKGASWIFSSYTTSELITYDNLKFLSFWRVLDIMLMGERQYYFIWLHPQTIRPENVVIPIVAAVAILLGRRNRLVLYFSLMLVLGIFLTKGVHEPAGYVYYELAKNLPYGLGAILRNPTKFIPLVVYSYSFLISYSIVELFSRYRKIFARIGLVGALVLVFYSIFTVTLTYLSHYTWKVYSPTYIPNVYINANKWLLDQGGNFTVVWLPVGGAYVWKPYVISAFPLPLSSAPASSVSPLINNKIIDNATELCNILTYLGVKYVLYHNDSLDVQQSGRILKGLRSSFCLRPVASFAQTVKAIDVSNSPPPKNGTWILGLPVQTVDVPLKIIRSNDTLVRGENTIVVYYRIPSFVVNQGYKGRFWPGFSVALNVYKAGSLDLNDRLVIAILDNGGLKKQILINDTSGYIIFNVNLTNCPYNAVDIYANFYGCCFKPLTPSYYLGRFRVEPDSVPIGIEVFENTGYRGPVFVANGSAEVLSVVQLDPIHWRAVVNASGPFLLVFTQPFDRLWEIELPPGYTASHFQCYMANCYLINPNGRNGVVTVDFVYGLQIYQTAGFLVTFSTLAALAYLAFFRGSNASLRSVLRRFLS